MTTPQTLSWANKITQASLGLRMLAPTFASKVVSGALESEAASLHAISEHLRAGDTEKAQFAINFADPNVRCHIPDDCKQWAHPCSYAYPQDNNE